MGENPEIDIDLDTNQQPKAPPPEERTQVLSTKVTPFEYKYLEDTTKILYSIDYNGLKILKEDTISELIRVALGIACTSYQANIFSDPTIITKMGGKEDVRNFIKYREQYMQMPVGLQLEELRRLGLVKQKTK